MSIKPTSVKIPEPLKLKLEKMAKKQERTLHNYLLILLKKHASNGK